MKRMKIGLTAIALIIGVVSVFAQKVKVLTTTFTIAGSPATLSQIEAICDGSPNLCGHTYKDDVVVKDWFFSN